MREILFRGKEIDNGEWVDGFLFNSQLTRIFWATAFNKEKDTDETIFYCEGVDVIPETVGQYTGLKDKNGKKIFEGDIVEEKPVNSFDRTTLPCMVDFKNGMFGMWVKKLNQKGKWIKVWEALCTRYEWDGELHTRLEVISNIHDNPELLEERINGTQE